MLYLLLGVLAGVTDGQFFTKSEITDPLAVCTDGSPAVTYISQGAAGSPWLLWLDGPTNPLYIKDSAKPQTTTWPDIARYSYGPFALNDAENPFKSYSAAVLMYCSDDFFLGNSAIANSDGTTSQHRGYVIMEAWLKQLQPLFADASKIVAGGATVGALGLVSNAALLTQYLPAVAVSLLLDSPFFTPTVTPTSVVKEIIDSSPSPTCALAETHVVFSDNPSGLVPCCLDYLCASDSLPTTMRVMLLQSLAYATSVNDALLLSSQDTAQFSQSQVYNLSLTTTWNGALVSTAIRQAANERAATAYIAYACVESPILSPFGNAKCLTQNYADTTTETVLAGNAASAFLGCSGSTQHATLEMGDFLSTWINAVSTWGDISVQNSMALPRSGSNDMTIKRLIGTWMLGTPVRAEEACQGMNCNPTCTTTSIFLTVAPYTHIGSLAGLFLVCTLAMMVAGLVIAYCRVGQRGIAHPPVAELENSSALSQSMATGRALEAKGLTYWNSNAASSSLPPSLKSVSFSIPPGSLVAIIGGSGCGKSTLLELLAGRRDSGAWCGDISVSGKNVSTEWLARNTGIVRQSLSPLVDQLTLVQNLEFAAMLRVQGCAEFVRERIDFVLEKLELAEFRNSVTGTLSGGQRKRAEVALELLTQPDILFLDEPTSALDARTALNFMDWIAKVSKSTGSSIILSIHQPREEIWALFTHIVLLEKGFLVYSGPPFGLAQHHVDGSVNPADVAVELAGNRRDAMVSACADWSRTLEDEEPSAATKMMCWMKSASEGKSSMKKLTTPANKGKKRTKLVQMESQIDLQVASSTPSMMRQIRSFLLRLMAVHPPWKFTTLRSAVGLSLLSIFVALLLGMVFWAMDTDSVRTKALAFLVLVPAFLSNSFVVSYVCEDIPIYFIERSNYYVTPIAFFIHHILHLVIYIVMPFTVFPFVQYFLLWGRVLGEFEFRMFVQMVGFAQICFVAFLSLFVFSCFFMKGNQSSAMIMNSSIESFFALFSGFLAPLPSLTLAPIRWLTYVSPAMWGYVGVAYSVANRQFPGDCGPATTSTETTCALSQSGNVMIYGLGFEDLNPITAWLFLVLWSVAFFFLTWLVLARPWHKGAVKLVVADGGQAGLETLAVISAKEQEIFAKSVADMQNGTLSPKRGSITKEPTGDSGQASLFTSDNEPRTAEP